MNRPRPAKLPPALTEMAKTYAEFQHELDDVVRIAMKWPEVYNTILAWADSLTTTNIGFREYELGKLIIERVMQEARRQS